ncbi:hypothetical protein RISK_000814 [Rhodopirellula islandica]|uniref:Uncharacterized protein n=1 Tax=Rhodopirellula islandica TaxID=595434 RepID=A0A0J1BKR2_RHOIS|nr:hypothetical protein RISK_000814 [Rhodopirellula islandica]
MSIIAGKHYTLPLHETAPEAGAPRSKRPITPAFSISLSECSVANSGSIDSFF